MEGKTFYPGEKRHGNQVVQSEQEDLVLTLTQAVSQALNCNRQLFGTVESLTQAQYGIDLAKSEFHLSVTPNSQAGYRGADQGKPGWRMGGGLDVSKKLTTGTLLSVEPSVVKTGHHYLTSLQAMVTQPLLRGLGREYQLSSLRGAQFSLRTAYRHLYIAQVQLIMHTIQALYEIVKSERSLLLDLESYERMGEFFRAAKLRERIGVSDPLDVYRAEIELRQAEDAFKESEERVEEAKDHLRDLLALPFDSPLKIDVPLLYTPHELSLDEAIALALAHRVEMDQAQDEYSENERLSKLAKHNLYPELNLVFNYSNRGHARHFIPSRSGSRENRWEVGLTTSTDRQPLTAEMAYEESVRMMAAASRGCEQAKVTLILEVKQALRQLERAHKRIHLQEEQMKTVQGELYLAKIKFDHGMADNFHVIQAEKLLRSVQQSYWSALIDHIVGEFQLLVAMGLLIDKPKMAF